MFDIIINTTMERILLLSICTYICISGIILYHIIKKYNLKKHIIMAQFKSIYSIFIACFWMYITHCSCILCDKSMSHLFRLMYFFGIIGMLIYIGISLTEQIQNILNKYLKQNEQNEQNE